MGYTDQRIARLETQLTEIDQALSSLAEGAIEEVQINGKRYRFADKSKLQSSRASIESSLSALYAMKTYGGRTLARKSSR